MTFQEYEAEVKKHLTPERFFHSQCVAREAEKLAERYGADREKARLAGILHDVMKDTPKEEQLKKLRGFGILLSKTEMANPKLWHAICGAAYAKNVLLVEDEEILGAIRWHTSGKRDMTLLEKVLFVADYVSQDRTYPGVEQIRRYAYDRLEKTIVEGVEFTVRELMEQRLPVAPESVEAYNDAIFVLSQQKEDEE